MRLPHNRQRGISLVEVLVVAAVVAIVLGLTLAGVQKVRASAAKAQCANNLRQLGQALHQYHGRHGRFPAGCSYRKTDEPTPHMGWLTRVLPDLGHAVVWDEAVAAFKQDKFFQAPPHRPVLGLVFREFACPSDPRVFQPKEYPKFRVGLTSYLGVSGVSGRIKNGMLYLNSRTRLADITDGASQCIAAGERPPSPDGRYGWWYAGWGLFRDGSADLHLGVRERAFRRYFSACTNKSIHFQPGDLANNCDALHFWSLHTAGGHFLFADGSVRFVGYDGDRVLPALATRAGGETAGVPD